MNENDTPTEGELVSVETSVNQALQLITKAEIDQQIATAHAYPRSIAKFKARAIEMATLDEETAESCIYVRPVGKKKDEQTGEWRTEYAEGLSIRTAEIVGACYGNLRVGSMLVEMTPRFVKARGFAHDLETNFASTSEVIESTVDKNGKPYSERLRVVVAKAALSKARRDATFNVVPKALCKPIEAAARKVAVGDATTLEKRRGRIMQWIEKLQIDAARVFKALGVAGIEDLNVDHLTTLQGIRTAIKDGDTTVDEAFPPITEEKGNGQSAAAAAAAKAAEAARSRASQQQPAGQEPPQAPASEARAPAAEADAKASDLAPGNDDEAREQIWQERLQAEQKAAPAATPTPKQRRF